MSNFTEDPENDHLADAMTEELIARLSQVRNLRVVSHTSVMQYKSTTKSLRQIGHELRADAVIEGSVTTTGPFIRVTLKLVRIADEQQIWAAVFEQKKEELTTLEDQLAALVLREIGIGK